MADVSKWKKFYVNRLIRELLPSIPAEKGILTSRNPVKLLALTAEICDNISKKCKYIAKEAKDLKEDVL